MPQNRKPSERNIASAPVGEVDGGIAQPPRIISIKRHGGGGENKEQGDECASLNHVRQRRDGHGFHTAPRRPQPVHRRGDHRPACRIRGHSEYALRLKGGCEKVSNEHFIPYNILIIFQAWNHVLMDIGLWRRLLKRRMNNDVKFKQLCHLNGWGHHFRQEGIDTKTLAYFFFASTDLKDLMKV